MRTVFVLLPACGLVAVWLGYPALIAIVALVARFRRRGQPLAPIRAPRPTVSVIIATREADELVRQRIADVMATEYPLELIEIIVGLDRGERGPSAMSEWLQGEHRVQVVAADLPGGKALALNAAVRASRGEILVLTDTRQRFNKCAISELVRHFDDTRLGAVSGCLDIRPSENVLRSPAEYYWLFERWLREREAQVHSTIGVTGAIYAMRRSLWMPLPSGLILDDVFTPMRLVLAGYRVAFSRTARAIDYYRFGAEEEYRRKVRTLTGVLQLCSWLPGILIPWRNPVWFQFVAHKLLRLLTPYFVVMMLAAGATSTWDALRELHASRFAPVGVGTVFAVLAWPQARLRVGRAVAWSYMAHAAPVMAMLNGLRGRWNVW